MTREYALKVNQALIDVDDFALFMEEVATVIAEFALGDFENKLNTLLTEEYIRRKNILEKL